MKNKYEIMGDSVVVYCNRKGKAIEVVIDLQSLPIMDSYPGTWGIDESSNTGKMYCKLELNKPGMSRLYLHRLLTNCPTDKVVDHKDGDSLNNRLCNLKVTTQRNNVKNMKLYSTNKSGHVGVSYKESLGKNCWVARVSGKEIGYYQDIIEASRAVNRRRKELGLTIHRTPIKLS